MVLTHRYDTAMAAAEIGADFVQYRDKTATTPETLMRIVEGLKGSPTRLFVNDRWDWAREYGADGVWLGREDTPLETVVGKGLLVGATIHFPHEYDDVRHCAFDFAGVGPVFGTRSKATSLPDLGLHGLKTLVEYIERPVLAIGGVGLDNAADVLRTGAAGLAVLSAFESDPYGTGKKLRQLLDEFSFSRDYSDI
jgi:thiamine-phosphate pyrophosphorylase